MRPRIHWGAACSLAVLLTVASDQVGRCAPGSDAPPAKQAMAEPTIVGIWQADAVSMVTPGGTRKNIDGKDAAFSVTISEKKFTMRVHDKVLVEMSYVLDAKQAPCPIDLESADGVLLGICERKGERLRLSLNDEAKGRPLDFDQARNGMVLSLVAFEAQSLYGINVDGSGLRRILSMSDYTEIGSPKWSHDGKKIVCGACKSIYGEAMASSHILVTNVDGSGMRDLGPGSIPNWSLDDKQLTFSSYGVDRGVCIMNSDGSGRRCLDPDGWGSAWSSKRNEIAYTYYDNGHSDLGIYDLTKKQRRTLLARGYRQIAAGIAWSPDGDWLCFKGTLPEGGCEIAAVSAAGEKKGFKILVPSSICGRFGDVGSGLSWGGSASQILFSGHAKANAISRLYLMDFKKNQPFQLFHGLPQGWDIGDSAWSQDGKQIVFSACPSVKTAAAPPKVQTAQVRSQSINNLKQVALGMLNHESAVKEFPLPGSLDPKGKPLLSWRVHILPYLEEAQLYKEFHLDEPWDSPHNRTLIARMPAVYHSPASSNREKGRTNYLLPVGNGAAFRADKATHIAQITDGTSNTLMVLEVDDDQAVTWTKPDDWAYDPKQPLKGLGKLYDGKFHTAFCDGSVHILTTRIRLAVFRDLIERADGHAIDASGY